MNEKPPLESITPEGANLLKKMKMNKNFLALIGISANVYAGDWKIPEPEYTVGNTVSGRHEVPTYNNDVPLNPVTPFIVTRVVEVEPTAHDSLISTTFSEIFSTK
jgi:hypothetical protein